MAIDLATDPGGIFACLGDVFAAIGEADTSATTIDARINELDAHFASALRFLSNGLFSGGAVAMRDAESAYRSAMMAKAQEILIETVHADAILPVKSVEEAIRELIRQMVGGGGLATETADNDVDASTVSASVAAVTGITNVGNGALCVGVLRPDGRANQNVFAEVVEFKVTSDAGFGATARSEPVSFIGAPAVSPSSPDWPDGSGCSGNLTTSDAVLNASTGNLLYNSDFEDVTTSNQPDYWGAPLVGVCGTDIFSETSTVYRTGKKALKFTGTGGSPLSSIAQTFAATSVAVGTSGTTGVIYPSRVYAFNCFVKDSGAGLLAGVVKISLINGTSGAIITDDAGVDLAATIAYNGTTASYAAFNSGSSGTGISSRFFTTPKVLPTSVKLRVAVSTALTSGESIYIADLCFVECTQLYTGGPYAAIFAGATDWGQGDRLNATVANNYAGAIQLYFDRCFDMKSLGMQLPSDSGGTETINDSLIG